MNRIKYSFLAALIIFSQQFAYSQTKTKDQLISDIIKVTAVIPQAKSAVNAMLDAYAKRYPTVPPAKWDDIKSHVDYAQYQKAIYNTYNQDMNEKELGQLLYQYQHAPNPASVKMPDKLKTDLYAAGNEFGHEISALIKSRISQ